MDEQASSFWQLPLLSACYCAHTSAMNACCCLLSGTQVLVAAVVALQCHSLCLVRRCASTCLAYCGSFCRGLLELNCFVTSADVASVPISLQPWRLGSMNILLCYRTAYSFRLWNKDGTLRQGKTGSADAGILSAGAFSKSGFQLQHTCSIGLCGMAVSWL